MLKRTIFLTLFCCGIFLYLDSLSFAQKDVSFKVIVHTNNPNSKLSKKVIFELFRKRIKKWKNGKKALPVDLVEDSDVRKNFSKEIHGKKVAAIKAYWQKQIFSGRNVPPPEKKTEKEVLEYVHKNEGAIGYIAMSTSIKNFSVKVLKIVN